MSTQNHLNQSDLAKRWGIAEGTLENWRTKGIGPVFLKLHNRIVYSLADVIDYENESRRRSTSRKLDGGAV